MDIEAKQDAVVPRGSFNSFSFRLFFLDKDYRCRQTALHKAAREGYEAVVSLLLMTGANIAADDGMGGLHGWRPLHYAVRGGHKAIAQLLLDGGANIEARGINGVRPLHIAVAGSREGLFDFLLERGADVNATDTNKWSALYCTIYNAQDYKIENRRRIIKNYSKTEQILN